MIEIRDEFDKFLKQKETSLSMLHKTLEEAKERGADTYAQLEVEYNKDEKLYTKLLEVKSKGDVEMMYNMLYKTQDNETDLKAQQVVYGNQFRVNFDNLELDTAFVVDVIANLHNDESGTIGGYLTVTVSDYSYTDNHGDTCRAIDVMNHVGENVGSISVTTLSETPYTLIYNNCKFLNPSLGIFSTEDKRPRVLSLQFVFDSFVIV